MSEHQPPSRRTLMRGAAALGIGVPFVAACGRTANDSGSSDGSQTTADPSTPLTKASDVPVGSGVVLADQGYVVTQPKAGEFEGFSSICTHQGCPVASVTGQTINCTCHGSKFSTTDGSVVHGPATEPLPKQPVRVQGGNVLPGAS